MGPSGSRRKLTLGTTEKGTVGFGKLDACKHGSYSKQTSVEKNMGKI